MAEDKKQVHPLIPAQMQAVQPGDNIWLSASAGTGKTQVLTARVICLLMTQGVNPENLLCITFTKAGAAEMAERINRLLASWVQMDDHLLFSQLEAIGAPAGPAEREKARQLFAKILEAPGGGLQIQTIHSLCQSLLGSFPEEAGLVPGFKPVEGREQEELYHEALSEMILNAEARGDVRLIENLQQMSVAMGEEASLKFLQKCAGQAGVMAGIPDDEGSVILARKIAGVTFTGSAQNMVIAACADGEFDHESMEEFIALNEEWGKGKADSRGGKRAIIVRNWLGASPKKRADIFGDLHGCWAKSKIDEPLVNSRGYTPLDEHYADVALPLFQWSLDILSQMKLAEYADRLAGALLVGKAYSSQYAEAKHARGLVDFDDMIQKTAALLRGNNMADWVRYKLDRQLDHILVDEAQDTNAAQWDILHALSDDFFSGAAAKPDKIRTIFSVGDYKQAIFGFQGTDPAQYARAGDDFAAKIAQTGGELKRLTLSQSFRSTGPVLNFVNAVIRETGADQFGIDGEIEDHFSANADIGQVELFAPILPPSDNQAGADQGIADPGGDDDEQWLSSERRILAHHIAGHVRQLIDEAPILASTGKPLVAGDIMILLRARGEMASLLVSRLHAAGVPVAGIDRLKLQEPLAVQDLLSVIRFVLQPGDDLSLACILTSPLMGWSHDDLLQDGYRAPDNQKSLWRHLRDQPELQGKIEPLRALLAGADFTTPYHFLENILSGPMQGRRKFHARLGGETLIPIEELLNASLQFEKNQGGGLQAFLAWMERGDTVIKREEASGKSDVRVMTVHGAKGLEAPIVILADVTADPTKKPDNAAELLVDEGRRLPMLAINKADRFGKLNDVVERQKRRDLNEHYRLLYVAMTRAKERLILTGSLGPRAKGVAPEYSWFTALHAGMEAMGCVWQDDPQWGQVMRYCGADAVSGKAAGGSANEAEVILDVTPSLPQYLREVAAAESRPSKPLTPSQLDDDDHGEMPASRMLQQAAEKGRLIHALFERIIGDDLAGALKKAGIWLKHHNRDPHIDNDAVMADIQKIITNPDWSIFFGPDARAEIPLAAVVGDIIVSGRVDRLVIEPDIIHVLDFKTGRNIPASEKELPTAFLRQMAHYVAAIEVIFPGRAVEASFLFTHGPRLIPLSAGVLQPHKPNS